jgi:hypothetical protein
MIVLRLDLPFADEDVKLLRAWKIRPDQTLIAGARLRVPNGVQS